MTLDPRRDIAVVRDEIAGLPALILDQAATSWEEVQTLLDDLDADRSAAAGLPAIPRVVLTGCGDSLFAGMAARWAFERYAGLPAEAIEALDLARYYVDTLPRGTLVLPVSYSGQVARTVEAARNAAHFGATVVAVTGRPERRLGQTAARMLPVRVPSLGYSLGTSTYAGLLLALYLLALGLGQRRGVLTGAQVDALLDSLRAAGAATETAIAATTGPIHNYVAGLTGVEAALFLGGGPNYASALFGAAKLFEGAQMDGQAQNIEEWAHAQYFISGPNGSGRTIVLAPRGRALDRAREIATELRFIDAPFAVITDDDPAAWRELTPDVFALSAAQQGGRKGLSAAQQGGRRGLSASRVPEVFSPLLFTAPLSLLGYELAVARGKQSYNFASPAHEEEHYHTLHESAFRDLDREDLIP